MHTLKLTGHSPPLSLPVLEPDPRNKERLPLPLVVGRAPGSELQRSLLSSDRSFVQLNAQRSKVSGSLLLEWSWYGLSSSPIACVYLCVRVLLVNDQRSVQRWARRGLASGHAHHDRCGNKNRKLTRFIATPTILHYYSCTQQWCYLWQTLCTIKNHGEIIKRIYKDSYSDR